VKYDFPIFDKSTNTIHQFRGEFSWLSNFAECKISYKGYDYDSVEHAYIAQKSDSEDWKDICANGGYSAGNLKKVSKEIDIIEDWDNLKLPIMRNLLVQKFTQEPFKSKLLQTDNMYIEEGNWWGDEFWGISFKTGNGKNYLGKLIMFIRMMLKSGKL
jgi:ribA/ribD-fused uncharacterized protein